VGALTDPIIVYDQSWGETLPEWLKGEIKMQRLAQLMKDEEGLATDAEDMARVLAQVAPAASKMKGVVRLRWEEERLLVSARDEDGGEIEVSVRAHFTEPGKIALSLAYLQHYFKGRSGPVTISLSGGVSGPALLAHKGKPNALIMPMMVQW